jgi:hypothetical protein
MELALLGISMVVTDDFGKEAYISALGLHGLRLIENLMPLWASPVRKRVRALEKKNLELEYSDGGSFICYEAHVL